MCEHVIGFRIHSIRILLGSNIFWKNISKYVVQFHRKITFLAHVFQTLNRARHIFSFQNIIMQIKYKYHGQVSK